MHLPSWRGPLGSPGHITSNILFDYFGGFLILFCFIYVISDFIFFIYTIFDFTLFYFYPSEGVLCHDFREWVTLKKGFVFDSLAASFSPCWLRFFPWGQSNRGSPHSRAEPGWKGAAGVAGADPSAALRCSQVPGVRRGQP